MEINSTSQEVFSISAELPDAYTEGMETWADRVNAELRRKGWPKAELIRRTGIDKNRLYKQLQNVVEQPRGDVIQQIANALGVHEYWITHGRGPRFATVPLVGYLGAGEEFYPIDDHQQGAGLDDVSLSIDVADPIAIRVRGSSMSPVYRNGDDIFCSRLRGADIESAIGQDCALLTSDGAGYVKLLRRGSDGRFILRSYNPAFDDIEIARLEWVAPILAIRRANAR